MGMVNISRELELATHMTAQEIRREMTVYEFQGLLGSRGIPVNYGVEDFLDDLDTIQRLKLDQ
jgi:predicted HTH domain antitoxin